MIQAGRLNRQITIQRHGTAQDATGQVIEAWSEVCQAWASIRHPGGLETVRAGAETTIVKASIRIRYRTDIDAGMRVLHGTTVYDIKAVLLDEVKREHVDLVCEAVTGVHI